MIISVYFKVVYTINTRYYRINTEWTPLELYNNIKPLIIVDFNINNFELLDTITNFDGITEEKPKIEPLNNISLEEIYNNKFDQLAIYIRPL